MVFAPHPDDEALGCGVLILRKRQAGVPVHIVIATDGARSHGEQVIPSERLVTLRRDESIEAARRLGLTEGNLTFLDYPDGALRQAQRQLERDIEAIISKHNPEVVVVTSVLDAHPDHQTLAHATRAVIAGTGAKRALYEYPIWYWERLPWIHRPSGLARALWHFLCDPVAELSRQPPLRVQTDGYVERKRAALEAHQSQVRPFPPGSDTEPLLPPAFVKHFFQPYEIYFPILPSDIDATVDAARLATSTPEAGEQDVRPVE